MAKKSNWVSRLKKDIKTLLSGPGYSPAGKKYLKESKRGTTVKQLYKRIKQDNPGLSDSDAMQIAKDEISGAYEKRRKRGMKAAEVKKGKWTYKTGRISIEKGFRNGRRK